MVALALNTVLPVVGIDHPLSPAVLALTWLVIDVAMLSWRRRHPLLPEFSWSETGRRMLDARFEGVTTLAVGSLLLAVVGGVRLNNGASGFFALVAQALAAAALVALMLRPAGSVGRDSRVLALVATALLIGTSLRGWAITGHDIQAEYLSFGLTNDAQHWQMSALQNAYNACLSVNICPDGAGPDDRPLRNLRVQGPAAARLRAGAGADLPLLPALPDATSGAGGHAITMAFPTFFTDMPYLVRQEMAFFFLALLLVAATEPGPVTWRRHVAVGALGVGVVLSHYSTTYQMMMALVFALLAMAVLRQVGRRWARSASPTALSRRWCCSTRSWSRSSWRSASPGPAP